MLMQKIYLLAFASTLFLISGCSKDVLKRYENRIIGTWQITNVNRLGFGGNPENLPFRDGEFTFNANGTLRYTDHLNNTYQGNWEIIRRSGSSDDNNRVLRITAIDFNNQTTLAEYYDDMNFRGTNFFVARIDRPFVRLTTHFRR